MQPSGGGNAVLGYLDHYVVDGGKAFAPLNSVRDRRMMNVDSGGCEFFSSGGKTWQIHRRSNQ
jgi:hypothetical protein